MRQFLILGHTASIDPGFTLNDLPGGAGRMDVLCRAIGATMFLSHGIRRDVVTHLLLQEQVHVRIRGDRVKRLNPDERSTAALIRYALKALSQEDVESSPGITVAPRSLEDLMRSFEAEGLTPVVLDEQGTRVEDVTIPETPVFILSDHREFSEGDREILRGHVHLSLGPTALHTSQAITIVHYLLDRLEEDRNEDLVLVHTAFGEPKAQLIKHLLEDFDIPVNVMTHVPPSVFPMVLNGLAEAQIWVRRRDVAKARRIISDYFQSSDLG
jgi:tRNA (pseudouridine54-N1)-methyltransferase